MEQDLWNVLGIEPTGDKRAIKRAYAKMGQVFHPEEHPEEFQLLRRAYESALEYASGEPHEAEIKEKAAGRACEAKPLRDKREEPQSCEQTGDRLFEAVKREQSRETERNRQPEKEIKDQEEHFQCRWNEELIARGLGERETENWEETEGCRQLFDHIKLLCAIDDQSPQIMADWDSLARDQLFRTYGNSPVLLEMLEQWMKGKKESLSITAVGGLHRIYGMMGLSQEELAVKYTASPCFLLFGRELIQLSKDKKNLVLLNSYIIWPRTKPKPSFLSIKRPSGIIIRLLLLLLILLARFSGVF